MKPLFVLTGVFIVSAIITFFAGGHVDYFFSGRIALCVMLLFTAIGHFAFTKGMAMMVPGFIPFKTAMVYLTGLLEIMAAVCLLFPSLKEATGWALILFFIILLPTNILAAVRHIDYEKANYEGKGLNYLWIRIPMQALFIAWTYFFAVKY